MSTVEHAPPSAPSPEPSERAPLALESVSVRFGGIRALSDVSMTVDFGEVVGLIGPNGAGKTTLFDPISGVRLPDEGRVFLGGKDVTHEPRSAVRDGAFGGRSSTSRAFGWLTVEDNVLTATEWEGGGGGIAADLVAFPTRRRRETQRHHACRRRARALRAHRSTHRVGRLAPDRPRAMVEVARALIAHPKVLMLDEPTSGLDHAESARLGEQIQRVRADGECGVLLVEHDVGFVMEQCDRIVVLDLGQVLAMGSPAEIQQNPAVRRAYLGDA